VLVMSGPISLNSSFELSTALITEGTRATTWARRARRARPQTASTLPAPALRRDRHSVHFSWGSPFSRYRV
jgi:hypothetical protein